MSGKRPLAQATRQLAKRTARASEGQPATVISSAQQQNKQQQNQRQQRRAVPQGAKPGPVGWTDLGQGAVVRYEPHSFPGDCAAVLQQLEHEVPWLQREVHVMSRRVMQPRLVAYMADDPSLAYTYSGTRWEPERWTPTVLRVKEWVERMCSSSSGGGSDVEEEPTQPPTSSLQPTPGASGLPPPAPGASGPPPAHRLPQAVRFNSCLLNYYRGGSDHISWHSDNEPLYGQQPLIASASFGAARDFMLRRTEDRADKYRFPLGDGDVLVMAGTTQQHWMHSIPKRPAIKEPRISITFRTVLHPEGDGRRGQRGGPRAKGA